MIYLSLSALIACIDSSNLVTSEIVLEAHADQHETGVTDVYAPLSSGGQSVNIAEGDSLCIVVPAGGAGGADAESCLLEGTTTLLQAEFLAGTDVSAIGVELRRSAGESALGTVMAVPDGFDLDDPGSASVGTDLTLTWSPTAADPMRFSVSGNCVEEAGGEIAADEGAYTISGDLLARVDDGSTDCVVEVEVERYRAGTVDPALDPTSSAQGVQVRAVELYFAAG